MALVRDMKRIKCKEAATHGTLFLIFLVVINTAFAGKSAVRLGMYKNSPKVNFDEQGRTKGIFVDIMEQIAHEAGWSLEYVPDTLQEKFDRLAAVIFNPTRLFFAASRHTGRTLLKTIDRHPAEMKSYPNSVYYASLKHWNSEEITTKLAEWLKLSLLLMVALLLAVFYWNLSLRTQVARRTSDITDNNRMLRLLSDCNETLFRFSSERELLDKLCHLIVSVGGYTAAWIAVVDKQETETPVTTAYEGIDAHTVKMIEGSIRQTTEAAGSLSQLVIRDGKPLICKSLFSEYPELCETAQKLKLRECSLLCFPLISGDTAIGTLTIIQTSSGEHADRMLELLREIAGEIAFGISHLRLNIARQTASQEQHQLEERLAQTHKMETIGQLAGGVAHDFNNGLQTILGFAELGIMQSSDSDPRTAYLQEIIAAAQRAKKLTGQLLAFSRKAPMEISRVQLNNEIETRRKMLERLIGEDIRIEIDLEKGLPLIYADTGHIEQVMLNLVVNACDAMTEGGVILIGTSTLQLDETEPAAHPDAKPGRYVQLRVSDTGCGMTPEVQARIFDPFFTTKPKDKGTGLGLSTVYGVVRQLKGWIQVDTQVEHGTTFTIYFPAAGEQIEQSTEDIVTGSGIPERTARILVVEDQEDVGRITVKMLASLGHNPVFVTSVAEAFATMESEDAHFDLIYSDVVLGDGNGVELAEELNGKYAGLRFLFATGYADERSRWNSIQEHGWKCLIKPYTKDDLRKAVDEALPSV